MVFLPENRHGRSCGPEPPVGEAKKTLIRDHLDHCLDGVADGLTREQRSVIDEFKTITKYL